MYWFKLDTNYNYVTYRNVLSISFMFINSYISIILYLIIVMIYSPISIVIFMIKHYCIKSPLTIFFYNRLPLNKSLIHPKYLLNTFSLFCKDI